MEKYIKFEVLKIMSFCGSEYLSFFAKRKMKKKTTKAIDIILKIVLIVNGVAGLITRFFFPKSQKLFKVTKHKKFTD